MRYAETSPSEKDGLDLHIVVFLWPRVIDNVLEICRQLQGFKGRKTVIDGSGEEPRSIPGWDWIVIDREAYFGRQFSSALKVVSPKEIFYCILGDMEHADWNKVVTAGVEAFARIPYLGIWSADIDQSAWMTDQVGIQRIEGTDLVVVSQTDGCVWALHPAVCERLRALTYDDNNLGWGVDWAALAACHTKGRVAVRDRSILIHHPFGSGYSHKDATAQMHRFLAQLDPSEKAMVNILKRTVILGTAQLGKTGLLTRISALDEVE